MRLLRAENLCVGLVRALLLVLVFVALQSASGDELYLKDGRVLYGKVKLKGDKFRIELDSGQVKEFRRSYVQMWVKGKGLNADERKRRQLEREKAEQRKKRAAQSGKPSGRAVAAKKTAPAVSKKRPGWIQELIDQPFYTKALIVGLAVIAAVLILRKTC